MPCTCAQALEVLENGGALLVVLAGEPAYGSRAAEWEARFLRFDAHRGGFDEPVILAPASSTSQWVSLAANGRDAALVLRDAFPEDRAQRVLYMTRVE